MTLLPRAIVGLLSATLALAGVTAPAEAALQFSTPARTAEAAAFQATYGALAYGHPTSGAVAPTSGFHSVGDFVWSGAPGACSCQGWLVLTTGTAWTPGTDFKMVPLQ